MIYPVILAGGNGTRLWPVSTKSAPKQVQAFGANQKTLLQATYQRLNKKFSKENIFVVTTENLKDFVANQVDFSSENLILEPFGKNTSIAIGLAAVHILHRDPQGVALISSSDAFIAEEDKYLELVEQSAEWISKNVDKFLLFGVKPLYPETGYGYIHFQGPALTKIAEHDLFQVQQFKEKPDLATAEKYLANQEYLWNPAMFIFSARQLLNWYQKFLPNVFVYLEKLLEALNQQDLEKYQEILIEFYQTAEARSIDYDLLEHLEQMFVLPVELTWADVGHWRAVRDISSHKENQANVSNVSHVGLESRNNLLYSSSGKVVATLGVENLILVETDKVIFLCHADRAQEVKKLLEIFKEKGLEEYL
ncbi:hypothetical protein H6761_02005 [Candidatus Nomurabacteria bacterium]|nr:hypothetical protein [Candidatus Nomurabacteria bacterium]